MRCVIAVLAATIIFIWPAWADEWSEALALFNAGDYTEATERMHLMAGAGHMEAQDKLSHIYWYGDGVPVENEEALHWSLMAAEQNSAIAQFNLYVHYRDGIAVDRNDAEAARWLQRSVAQDFPPALIAMAMVLVVGRGVEADEAEGRRLLLWAAEFDDKVALMTAGVASLAGDFGLVPNRDAAETYLQRSAALWNPDALVTHAVLNIEGFWGEPDLRTALVYLRAAEAFGCRDVTALVWSTAAGLPADEMATAEDDYQRWRSDHPKPPHYHDGPNCLVQLAVPIPVLLALDGPTF